MKLKTSFLNTIYFSLILLIILFLLKFLVLDKFNNIFEKSSIVDVKSDEFAFELDKSDNLYLNLFTDPRTEIEIDFQARTSKEDIDCSKYKFKPDNTGGLIRKFKVSEILGENCNNVGDRVYYRGTINIKNLDNPSIFENEFTYRIIRKLFSWAFKNSSRSLYLKSHQPIQFKFFFNTKDKYKKENENIIILPSSNLFNYFATTTYLFNIYYNDYQINNYTDKDRDTNIPYLHFSRQLPIYKTKNTLMYPDYDQHVFKTLKNFNNLKVNYDLIHDYEITEDILRQYKRIIFPYHQEYVTDDMMEIIKNLLNNENNLDLKIISIGGANFYRPFKINKINGKIESFEYFFTKYPLWKYGFNGHGLSSECTFENEELKISRLDAKKLNASLVEQNQDKNYLGNYFLGEVAWKFKDPEKTILKPEISEDFFYDFKCINTQLQNQDEYFYWENSKEKKFSSPLFSIHQFKGGKVLQFNSDGAGLNFYLHEQLKEKFISVFK